MILVPQVLTTKNLILRSLGHISIAVGILFGIKYLGVPLTGSIVIAIKEIFDPHPDPFKKQFIYKSILDAAVWSAAFFVTAHFIGL